jgi:small-conductance mechanosensitive channel
MTTSELTRGDFYVRVERRIGWLTLYAGALGGLLAWRAASPRAAAGIAAGALLAWLNFYWLERGTARLVEIAHGSGADGEKRVPQASLFLMIVRYGLIAVGAYVIVKGFRIPIWSVLSGLLALGAAAIVASLYGVLFDNN